MNIAPKTLLPKSCEQVIVIDRGHLALLEFSPSDAASIVEFISNDSQTRIIVKLVRLLNRLQFRLLDFNNQDEIHEIEIMVKKPDAILKVYPYEKTQDYIVAPNMRICSEDGGDELSLDVVSQNIAAIKDGFVKMWLSGPPGCGKSMFVDKLINTINSLRNLDIRAIKMPVYELLDTVTFDSSRGVTVDSDQFAKITECYIKAIRFLNDGLFVFLVLDELDVVFAWKGQGIMLGRVVLEKVQWALQERYIGGVMLVDILPWNKRREIIPNSHREMFENSSYPLSCYKISPMFAKNDIMYLLDQLPLDAQQRRGILQHVYRDTNRHPFLTVLLLRQKMEELFGILSDANDEEAAFKYLLENKILDNIHRVPRFPFIDSDIIASLREIANAECQGQRQSVELLLELGILEECPSGLGVRITIPWLRQYLRS